MSSLYIVSLLVQLICKYIMRNLGWQITDWNQNCWEKKNQQAQICRWYNSNGRKWRGAIVTVEGERQEWKSWLKTRHSKNSDYGIWSHRFMTNRWVKMETVTDFIFLGSKVIVVGDYSRENKRHLLLGKKAMINLVNVKSRGITLPTKVHIIKALVLKYSCSDVIVGS